MTESYGRGQPGDPQQATFDQHGQAQHSHRANDPGTPAYGSSFSVPSPRAPETFSDSKGFFAALFDVNFTSFVTPKVVKALYILAMIGAALSGIGLALILMAFNVVIGVLVLIIWTPLSFVISIGLTRIVLEFFVVNFRIAEDLRAVRERSGLQ
jgi:hypothetical protein